LGRERVGDLLLGVPVLLHGPGAPIRVSRTGILTFRPKEGSGGTLFDHAPSTGSSNVRFCAALIASWATIVGAIRPFEPSGRNACFPLDISCRVGHARVGVHGNGTARRHSRRKTPYHAPKSRRSRPTAASGPTATPRRRGGGIDDDGVGVASRVHDRRDQGGRITGPRSRPGQTSGRSTRRADRPPTGGSGMRQESTNRRDARPVVVSDMRQRLVDV